MHLQKFFYSKQFLIPPTYFLADKIKNDKQLMFIMNNHFHHLPLDVNIVDKSISKKMQLIGKIFIFTRKNIPI